MILDDMFELSRRVDDRIYEECVHQIMNNPSLKDVYDKRMMIDGAHIAFVETFILKHYFSEDVIDELELMVESR